MSCKHLHEVCSITTEDGVNKLSVTNANGVEYKDLFCLVFTQCVSNLTGIVSVTVNGTLIPVYNKYSLPLQITEVSPRKLYHGYYVNSYVIIDAPINKCDHRC